MSWRNGRLKPSCAEAAAISARPSWEWRGRFSQRYATGAASTPKPGVRRVENRVRLRAQRGHRHPDPDGHFEFPGLQIPGLGRLQHRPRVGPRLALVELAESPHGRSSIVGKFDARFALDGKVDRIRELALAMSNCCHAPARTALPAAPAAARFAPDVSAVLPARG